MMLTRPNHLDNPMLAIIAGLAIISNFVSLYFAIFKLKVHKHVKRVLIWGIGNSCIGSVVVLAGFCLMAFEPEYLLIGCSMYSIPLQLCLNGGYVMSCVMGAIRYYMAKNTATSARINHNAITKASVCMTTAHELMFTGLWILTLSSDTLMELGTSQCLNISTLNAAGIVPLLEALVFIIASLYFDVAMIKFIKDRSRVRPLEMSVWSTSERSANTLRSHGDVMKTTIPVQSTILSTAFTIICSGLSAYLVSVIKDVSLRPFDRPIGKGILISLLGLQMPLILVLTVKNQEKNRRPVPPQGLQFHGQMFDSEDDGSKWTTVQAHSSIKIDSPQTNNDSANIESNAREFSGLNVVVG